MEKKQNNNKLKTRKSKNNKRIKARKPTVGTITKQLERNTIGVSKYTQPLQFRKTPMPKLLSELNAYRKHVRDRYLVGLIHPDLAVKHALAPKLFSDVPIPTGTIGLYGSHVSQTNASGNALISFRPPGQAGTANPMQFVTFNNNIALSGSSLVSGNNFVTTIPVVNVPTQKYRLVSCLIRVSYEGPLLNQSGKFFSSATYEPLPIKYFNGVSQADGLVDRYGDFGLIRNGLWNNSVDVQSPSHAIECLWIPTDPMDYMFQKQFSYYGTPYTNSDTLMSPAVDGAHICYLIAATGLPASTNLRIETYVNYETIADPSSAPYLTQMADDCWNSNDVDRYHKVVSNTIKNEGLIRPTQKTGSTWTEIMSSIMDVGLPLIKNLLF